MNNRALEIAQTHIRRMNPSLWNGTGKRPENFDSRIITYPIDTDIELDISFEQDDDGWVHLCEVRDKDSGELLEVMHGYGIDSPQNLADTIEDICHGKLADQSKSRSKQKAEFTKEKADMPHSKIRRFISWNKKKS